MDEINCLIVFNGLVYCYYFVIVWIQYRVLLYWVNDIDSDLKLFEFGVKELLIESIIIYI